MLGVEVKVKGEKSIGVRRVWVPAWELDNGQSVRISKQNCGRIHSVAGSSRGILEAERQLDTSTLECEVYQEGRKIPKTGIWEVIASNNRNCRRIPFQLVSASSNENKTSGLPWNVSGKHSPLPKT